MLPGYSVITVCLNASATIGRTVRSVCCQNPLPEQYVIVDGGSSDDTLAQARDALASGLRDRCRILAQEHRPGAAGIPAAWNQGLRSVDSECVFLLNADDWYRPDTVARVLGIFAAAPETDIVAGAISYRMGEDQPVLRVQRPRSLRLLPLMMPLPHPACFVRRRVYDRLGGYDDGFAVSADYDFVYRAYVAGCTFRCVDEPLVMMQPGGFARQRLGLARRETRDIARRHGGGLLLPWLAYLLRVVLNR